MSIYAVGDIHGCKKTFEHLLEKIDLKMEDTLVLLGDYIDRGPDSKGVFDLVFAYQEAGYQVHCLRGNHEQILLDASIGGPNANARFFLAGGKATLKSFRVTRAEQIEKKYLHFMMELPYYLEIGPYIFTHGGLNFDYENPLEAEDDMLWMRYWYDKIKPEWLGKRWIIHGHTPVPLFETASQVEDLKKGEAQVVNLDNGCVFSQKPHLGQLTALDLERCELISVACKDGI